MPRITVIVPVYNAASTIAATLHGLAHQLLVEPFEVIVVDNGSIDCSMAIAEAFRDSFQHFRIVSATQRRGAAYARNLGATFSKADYLAFMDADDVPAKEWLGEIVAGLTKHQLVASRHEGLGLNSAEALKARELPQTTGLQRYDYPNFLPHSGGCGLGVRNTVHRRLGGFDESWELLEDTEYCWRAQLSGVELIFLHDAVVHIRMRKDAKGSLAQAFRWGRYNVRLYKKFRVRMPKISWKKGIRWWLYFLAPRYMLRQLTDPAARPRWMWQVHWRLGRIIGSLRYRVWAL